MRIVCIGDSITYGAWDPEGGWVARIRRDVDRICIASMLKTFVLTYNLGISGDTTEHVRARLESALAALEHDSGDDYGFLLSLGTNDCVWWRHESRHWVDVDRFGENQRAIARRLQQLTDRVVLIGSAPVDETKTRPWVRDPSIELRNDDIRRYDQASAAVAAELGAGFLPVHEEFVTAGVPELMNEDGVHPNGAGHQLIARLVWPTVESWVNG